MLVVLLLQVVTAAEFIARLEPLERAEREGAIAAQLERGNLPSFLRRLVALRIEARDENGTPHRAVVRVMPDVLAIGPTKISCVCR